MITASINRAINRVQRLIGAAHLFNLVDRAQHRSVVPADEFPESLWRNRGRPLRSKLLKLRRHLFSNLVHYPAQRSQRMICWYALLGRNVAEYFLQTSLLKSKLLFERHFLTKC